MPCRAPGQWGTLVNSLQEYFNVDSNAMDKYEETPLCWAAHKG